MVVKELDMSLNRIDNRGIDTVHHCINVTGCQKSGKDKYYSNLIAYCDIVSNAYMSWYDSSPNWILSESGETINNLPISITGSGGTYLFSGGTEIIEDAMSLQDIEQNLMKSLQLMWYFYLGRENVKETIMAAGQILRANAELSKAAKALKSMDQLLIEGELNKEG